MKLLLLGLGGRTHLTEREESFVEDLVPTGLNIDIAGVQDFSGVDCPIYTHPVVGGRWILPA